MSLLERCPNFRGCTGFNGIETSALNSHYKCLTFELFRNNAVSNVFHQSSCNFFLDTIGKFFKQTNQIEWFDLIFDHDRDASLKHRLTIRPLQSEMGVVTGSMNIIIITTITSSLATALANCWLSRCIYMSVIKLSRAFGKNPYFSGSFTCNTSHALYYQ